MSKFSSVFVCQSCGTSFPRWFGQCSSCQQWGTLVEEVAAGGSGSGRSGGGVGGSGGGRRKGGVKLSPDVVVPLKTMLPYPHEQARMSSGIGELDRVLGGGIVPGAVMVMGGEPGIGKSTLLTQMVVELLMCLSSLAEPLTEPKVRTGDKKGDRKDGQKNGETVMAKIADPKPILYVCGEESPSQITLRIKRILENEQKKYTATSAKNWEQVLGEHFLFAVTTDVDEVTEIIHQHKPLLAIIDSIQTMTTRDLNGTAGSLGQITESTHRLTETAKTLNIPLFLVGHVTKEGTLAGPKILEHIVDTVLDLSGERTGQLRLLRAQKNRFGATDEVGVFQVSDAGLDEVTNPSALFLEHVDKAVPGSAPVCVLEGTRPLIVEVQSLVVESPLAMPRRVGRGIELSRIQVLAAVLQKHCHLPLHQRDIFVNAAGGFNIKEPAVDLGLAVAIASSLKQKPIPSGVAFVGEVGLLGEIRRVPFIKQRLKEAKRLGFIKVYSREEVGTVQGLLKLLGLL